MMMKRLLSTSLLLQSGAGKRSFDKLEGMLSVKELTSEIDAGDIDTVCVVFTDHVGRWLGKRYSADFFLAEGLNGSHVCNYLLTVDIETKPRDGFALANWESGYGDFRLVPDLSTLRRAAWLPKTAIVQCDVVHHGAQPTEEENGDDDAKNADAIVDGDPLVAEAPRSILRKQVARLRERGLVAMGASELEYYIYKDSYEQAASKRHEQLSTLGWYLEDYNMLQSTRSEFYHQPVREALRRSGVPVENSKGESGQGQHELNVGYCDVLSMADRHGVFKQCMKEMAQAMGVSVTFMAKPSADAGSSCHMHLSLVDAASGENVFAGPLEEGPSIRCSQTFRYFLGGWMRHMRELIAFYAPTVNSYKRYVSASWAPTTIAWSADNRTAGFRIIGSGRSLRIECRIPGADCNPYLGFAASIAAGLDGIDNRIEPPLQFSGDAYALDSNLPTVPATLTEAIELLDNSEFARSALGNRVVDHYVHHLRLENRAFLSSVTDWERQRYFEQI
jgi:glutamine synthetase